MSVAHWATVSDARERRDTHHDVLRPGRHGDRHMLLPRMHRGRCGGRVAPSVGVRRVDVSARISTPRRGSIFYEWKGHAELAVVSAAASGNLSCVFFLFFCSLFLEKRVVSAARASPSPIRIRIHHKKKRKYLTARSTARSARGRPGGSRLRLALSVSRFPPSPRRSWRRR